jgi:hypothetical protein
MLNLKNLSMRIVCMSSICTGALFSQENMGIIHDNYVPTQGALLNPSAIVDQKPWLSVQLAGINAYGRNNLAYLPNSTLFNRSDNVSYNYNRNNYSGYVDIEAQGPAASISLGRFSLGVHSAVRGYASIKNIPGELGEIIADESVDNVADGSYNTNYSRAKALAWGEIGLTFGGILFQKGKHMVTSAITVNRLFGLSNANLIVKNANVDVVSGNATLNNLDGKFSYTDFSLSAGKGWSTSIGGTYKKMKEDVSFYIPHSSKTGCSTPNYEYKVGVSLLDIGYINFNNNSQAATFDETLTTDEAENVFDGNTSELILNDQKTNFTSVLPGAVSMQFDYNVNDKVYLNASAIQKLAIPTFYGTERDNLLSVSARYESKWFGIGLPLILQNYRHPQAGLALRMGPLNIGTDHLIPFLFKTDVYAADIYFSLKFNIMKSPSCREKKRKAPKNKRNKKIYCPAWE